MKPENGSRPAAPAPASLIPLPSFLRGSFELNTPVPVAVEPGFLLLMAYIGYVMAGSFEGDAFAARIVVGAAVAAFSIFWHECGHASAFLAFGGRPKITLVATGGATTSTKKEPSFWKDLIVTASGPFAGYLLYLLARGALRLGAPWDREGLLFFALVVASGVNWVWTLLNLVPALPMDGGNIARILFQRFFGGRGLRYTYRLSFGVCAALVVYALLKTDWLLAFFAGSMAAGNRKTLRALALFTDAEMAPENQRVIARVSALENEGKWLEAHELLLTLEPVLGPRNICALAQQSFRVGRHRKAVELCEPLHAKLGRDYSVAFLLARAHAGLGESDSAVKWLKTAIAEGLPDAAAAVERCEEFKTLKDEPAVRAALPPVPASPPRDERL